MSGQGRVGMLSCPDNCYCARWNSRACPSPLVPVVLTRLTGTRSRLISLLYSLANLGGPATLHGLTYFFAVAVGGVGPFSAFARSRHCLCC